MINALMIEQKRLIVNKYVNNLHSMILFIDDQLMRRSAVLDLASTEKWYITRRSFLDRSGTEKCIENM